MVVLNKIAEMTVLDKIAEMVVLDSMAKRWMYCIIWRIWQELLYVAEMSEIIRRW